MTSNSHTQIINSYIHQLQKQLEKAIKKKDWDRMIILDIKLKAAQKIKKSL